jgi:hypothetical protein
MPITRLFGAVPTGAAGAADATGSTAAIDLCSSVVGVADMEQLRENEMMKAHYWIVPKRSQEMKRLHFI